MARTHDDKLAAAHAIAERLASRSQDETVWRDAEPLRRVAEAFGEQVAAEARVAQAVRDARESGLFLALDWHDARRLEADCPASLR